MAPDDDRDTPEDVRREAHRLLGERAELRGDLDQAFRHYELAAKVAGRSASMADVNRARAAAAARKLGRVDPPTDLKAVIVPLMEALADVRDQLDAYDPSGRLRRRYEAFRLALEEAGFPVQHPTRFHRAAAHRRLGELAEARGDLDAAALHYDLAIRARRDIGCARRLTRLHRYLEARAARQG